MFPANSRTKRTADLGNVSTFKNCRLCFSKYDPESGLDYNPRMPDLCCKFLHSSLTQELSFGSNDQPFCPRCSVTGIEIITLSEEMEALQKSLSELIFMFSLEILHRRGKTTETENISVKKLIEFDVSALPNNESWNMLPRQYDAYVSSPEDSHQIIPENVYIQNAGQILVPEFLDRQGTNDISIEEIKITIANDLEVGCREVPAFQEALSNTTPRFLNESGQLTIEEVIISPTNEVENTASVSSASSRGDSHQIKQENIYIQNAENQTLFPDVKDHQSSNDTSIGDLNYETIVHTSEVWKEEDINSEEQGTSHNTRYPNENDLLANTEVPLQSRNSEETYGESICSNNRLLAPILELQKLDILNEGNKIIAESMESFVFNNDQLRLRGSSKTIWTKRDSGSSFRLSLQNSELSNEEGNNGQLNSLPVNPMSTQATIMTTFASEEYMPTASCKQTSEGNETAKTGDGAGNIKKPYRGSLCKRKFETQSGMITYKKSDNVGKPSKCTLCQKSFTSNNGLYIHHRYYHSKREPLKCAYCPKRFIVKLNLTNHERTHTGEKPFSCDKCDFSTARAQCLKNHKNRRHGDGHSSHWKGRIFQCTYCPKRFPTNAELIAHVRTHTGEKPFSCDQCDYSSARKTNLKTHQNRRHGSAGSKFKCTLCECSFKTLYYAKQHFKRIHFGIEFSDDCVIQRVKTV